MEREKLIEKLKECRRQKQNIGVWHTVYGIPHFISGQIDCVTFSGIQLVGGYFIHFESDITTIEEISCQGKVIFKRAHKKT